MHEEMVPHPVSPYGASKLAGEGYCSAFYGSYGLKTCSLRFSNIYGPFSYHKGSVIAKFFKNIQAGKDLTIFGDGQQTRDFLYVKDLCQAIMASLTAEVPYGEAIQLGTGQGTSVNEMMETYASGSGTGGFSGSALCLRSGGRGSAKLLCHCAGKKVFKFCTSHRVAPGPSGNLGMVPRSAVAGQRGGAFDWSGAPLKVCRRRIRPPEAGIVMTSLNYF